jgi:hypothetical protein
MSNLLLEDEKKSMRRDYLVRLLATLLFLLSLSLLIGSVLLLPSFFLVESKKQTLLKETSLEGLKVSLALNPREVIADAERKIELLADVGNRERVGALLASLLKEKSAGIMLSSITYMREKDVGSFVVGGVALSRSALVDFSNKLERNSRFTDVQLPVSNLASNRDILFSISFKVAP